MMDSIPLVAITGQVRTDLIGNDAFQEAPTTGITRAVTKHSSIVMNVKDLAGTIYEAFHIASTGRPGPVLIDIPADIEFQKYDPNGSVRLNLPGYRPHTKATPGRSPRAPKQSTAPRGRSYWLAAASSRPTPRRSCGPLPTGRTCPWR